MRFRQIILPNLRRGIRFRKPRFEGRGSRQMATAMFFGARDWRKRGEEWVGSPGGTDRPDVTGADLDDTTFVAPRPL